MRLEVISDLQALARVRPHWDAVYDADPEAHFFLSWPWMAGRLERMRSSWFVLAAKTEADTPDYVAFFPLRARRMGPRDDAPVEVTTAGTPVADYTGFICAPRHQAQAIPLFARYVRELRKRIRWATLRLDQIRTSEERLRMFLSYYRGEDYEILREAKINRDGIDHSVCPCIDLPGDWDAYLSDCVSANTRQKLRRLLRRVEASPEFDLAEATAETIEEDLKALLNLWEGQWADRKRNLVDRIRQQSLAMLTASFEAGSLFVPVLRRNGSVAAAVAIFTDHRKKSCLFYMGGRDEAIGGLSPGLALHAFGIRHAISRGFRTYDFLRGDEAYKFSLGGRKRFIATIVVRATTEERRAGEARRAVPAVPRLPDAPSNVAGGEPASHG